MKFGTKSTTLSKKNLRVNLHTIKNYLKTQKKSFNGKVNTNFHNNKIPKQRSQSIFLSVILSIQFIDKNYYHQVFSEGCK